MTFNSIPRVRRIPTVDTPQQQIYLNYLEVLMKHLLFLLTLVSASHGHALETKTLEMALDIDFGFGVNSFSACDNATVPGRFWIRGKSSAGKSNAVFGYFDNSTRANTMMAIENCLTLAGNVKSNPKAVLTVMYTQTREDAACGSQFDVRLGQKVNQTLECIVR